MIDCHTRMVIGYATADNYKTPLIAAALQNAVRNVTLDTDAIFHSDRGSNYTSHEFGNHSGQQARGGFQGLPLMASRSESRTLSPCLATVEM